MSNRDRRDRVRTGMRLSLLTVILLAACDASHRGESCLHDSDCGNLVCNAPFAGTADVPEPGSCEWPADIGGLCHRTVECEVGLTCVLPPGVTSVTGGTCQNAD